MTKKILTKDEEADEIIRRLSKPKSRKFSAIWTVDAILDLRSAHDIDLENEMMNIMAKEMAEAIDKEIQEDLLKKWPKKK